MKWMSLFCLLLSLPLASSETFYVQTANEPQAAIFGEYSPQTADRQGTVILCHGYGADHNIWNSYIAKLNNAGWATIAFDFRGHGKSSGSRFGCTLGYHEVWDVRAVVEWAQSRQLPHPYVLYGVSMGGSTALRYAGLFDDDRIAGVLADSPYANAWTGAQQFLGLSPGLLPIGSIRDMLTQVDIPAALQHRHHPLTIWLTVGEKDCFPVDDARRILAAAPANRSNQLMVLPGLGHGEHWKRPEEHDHKIFAFLDQFSGPSSATCFIVGVVILLLLGSISSGTKRIRR